jgi:hypothetical protein
MTSHKKKLLTIGVTLAALAATGTAVAAVQNEQPHLIPPGAPAGYLAINPNTCRFLHHEIDVMPTATERYARAEDSRDDVKLGCLTNKLNKARLGGPGPRGPRGFTGKTGPAGPAGNNALDGYVQVTATGTGSSVTAQCPAGDVVLGGGSPDEVTGSYPSSTSSWTINRDHLSPKTMTVIATCAIGSGAGLS